MLATNFLYVLLFIVMAGFLNIGTTLETSATVKITMVAAIKKDTLQPDLDRHPLISIGGGYGVAMLGLEYPLDRNRDWNFEIIYYRLFFKYSNETHDSGIFSFRRYVISQENDIRPSLHIGLGALSLDVGGGVDITIIKRLLYSQFCVRLPFAFFGHNTSQGMPLLIALSARIML